MPDALYQRLLAFRIDEPGAAFPFHRRLATENGWSDAQARAVIEEYKRFVWLAVRAGHPVTPSPAVDEAWHLHLCYTRSYWDTLCGEILARPLHHGPTRGGAQEDTKFRDWYARTLASYREHFGEPPAAIWPDVDTRFRGGVRRKVDANHHWIVRKPEAQHLVPLAAAAAATLWVACSPSEVSGAIEPVAVLLVVVALVGVALLLRAWRRPRPRGAKRRDDHQAGTCGGCGTGGGVTGGGCGTHGRPGGKLAQHDEAGSDTGNGGAKDAGGCSGGDAPGSGCGGGGDGGGGGGCGGD